MNSSTVCKVLVHFGFLLFLLIIFCIAQLAFVLALGRKDDTRLEVWYVCIGFVLIIPEVVHIIQILWCASFLTDGKMKKWPLFRGICSGIILSIIEAGCISLLTYIILPRVPGYVILPLLNLTLLPELSLSVKAIQTKYLHTCLEPTLKILCCTALLLAGVISSIFLSTSGILLPYQAALLPLSLIGASVTLHTPVQNHIHGNSEASLHNTSLLYGSMRTFTYILFCILCFNSDTNGFISLDLRHLMYGFQVFSILENFHILISVHCTLSFVSLLSYIVPKKSQLSTFFPSFLSPILISIFFIVRIMHGPVNFDMIDISIEDIPVTADLIVVITTSAVLAMLPLSLVFIPMCFQTHGDSVEAAKQQRTLQRYNSVLLLQFMLIQQKVFGKHLSEAKERAMNKPSRVFICTTMYQEAEHEMDRLLESLDRVMTSQKLKENGINIESHIFLDNGADGKEMKDFGKQLLFLVEERIDLRPESGIMLYTPYGIQLHWVLECGTPLFIHLKDTKKVKAKKRWSQVMYLEYILQYRSKWGGMQTPYESKTMSSNPSFTESLDRLNDYYLPSSNSGGDKTTFSSSNYLDIPDIILNHAGDDTDGSSADNFAIDMASNDGSLFPSETRSRAGSDLFVKETPLEIHTQESTIFSVSLSMSNIAGPSLSRSKDDYILMTDADMSFDEEAVLAVVDVCKKDPDVGGVCGRTCPTGLYRHPILWLQMFEFAKDFWMIKSSQNVIGSVMCCPGCFSLFRFEALSDIFSTYSSPTETVMDVFTKDNGEDRWMCTLMMLKGWKLRYTQAGQNSTFCPETTLEFMKQRRRWLLSDYTNALLVIQNIANLMTSNSVFSLTYVLYLIQLFLIMVLYPGATVMMLSLGLELGSGIPLFAITPTFYILIVGYSIILIKDIPASVQLVISKVLIILLGLGTLYVFGSTSVIIVKALIQDYQEQTMGHIEYVLILSLAATYLLAGLLHPSELHLLVYGLPYMFFLPLLNIILPVYALCNIIDQSWGTRDNQLAKVPKFLSLPKLKKRKKKKKARSLSSYRGSYTSLNSSVLDLQNFNEDEVSFWEKVVNDLVGVNVQGGMTADERTEGLRVMRNKVVAWFLSINAVWVIVLCGCYGLLLQLMDNKTIFSVVMISSLGLTPLIQVTGMIVDRSCVLFRMISKYL
ncbi:uncharacterized protein LOC132565583 [Ylistrum balloti]|uniref:uncharacterized protein LOC132565583 n=1 Tax=Ylistrum balloti TaxID=509963 RepID=UPI002905EBF6|nr:uncharacterized protein LOC132565583 [Ylistrum balloti]